MAHTSTNIHTKTHTGTPNDGRSSCLECSDGHDADDHNLQACPIVQRLYPPNVIAELPKLAAWMAERLGRVQTLDRARAWLKASVFSY